MARSTQEFKVQSVKKVLSRRADQTQKEIADNLGVGLSTLQKWIRLAKDNQLEKTAPDMSKEPKVGSTEKSPHDWNNAQRLDAIMHCHSMSDEQTSSYCRENGIYPHHLKKWEAEFLSEKESTDTLFRQERKKLKQENKSLQKELNRKDKALSETAALLVLSKKCQAIWGEKEVD